ncbi:MAG TPA: cation transporter, partial [Algoriphagus sp.]|nr:cation transporter [Algoriphagus sp.]
MPAFSHWFFSFKGYKGKLSRYFNYALVLLGLVIAWTVWAWGGWVLVGYGLVHTLAFHFPEKIEPRKKFLIIAVTLVAVTGLLTTEWMPLGVSNSTFVNFLFIGLLLLLVLGGFSLFIKAYPSLLTWCLNNKKTFLIFPALVITTAASIWLGFNTVFGFIPKTFDQIGWNIRTSSVWSGLSHTFPGLGEEFMPSLNEGSFLLMPTTMPHSGVQENKEVLQKLDMLVTAIPEVELVVGKAGRAETAIDPAPISMFENTINYKSEYATDINGNRIRYKVNKDGHYELKNGLFHDPENS